MSNHSTLPDLQTCEQARLSRDPRFDGLFFTAVTSTGIYCRPVCPANAPKPANITYYPNAAAAEAAGFRPCLRCRPELAPEDGSWRRGDATVARALKLIEQGELDQQPLAALAERVHVGERQLRRLFVERLGASPIAVHGTRRLLFAKQLLSETSLPITEIALAAGFGSVRRFNASFQHAYRMPPRQLRKLPDGQLDAPGDSLRLRLGYRPPYDLPAMLDFLRGRALPGVEQVDAQSYTRVIAADAEGAPGWLRVSAWPSDANALQLEVATPLATRLLQLVAQVRRMFDLDADPDAISAVLSADPRLRPLLRKRPGLRQPSGWDGFEIAVRAVLGQQISVAAARTFAARVAQHYGTTLAEEHAVHGLTHLFPTPQQLVDADLVALGVIGSRADTIRGIAAALLEGRVDFRPERTLADFVERWTALKGIGPWTAHYLAMRGLGHPDAFPAEDLVLQNMVPNDGSRLSTRALRARAEHWRPWRAYATIQLWREATLQQHAAKQQRDASASPRSNTAAKKTPTAPTAARRASARKRSAT